jgi:hypothetical protein
MLAFRTFGPRLRNTVSDVTMDISWSRWQHRDAD